MRAVVPGPGLPGGNELQHQKSIDPSSSLMLVGGEASSLADSCLDRRSLRGVGDDPSRDI